MHERVLGCKYLKYKYYFLALPGTTERSIVERSWCSGGTIEDAPSLTNDECPPRGVGGSRVPGYCLHGRAAVSPHGGATLRLGASEQGLREHGPVTISSNLRLGLIAFRPVPQAVLVFR